MNHALGYPMLLLAGLALTACESHVSDSTAVAPKTAVAVYSKETLASIDHYEASAKDVSARLTQGTEIVALKRDTHMLLDLAGSITPAFVERHAACKEYLDAALNVREAWVKLDAEMIERDYHDDGALPKEGITPACYHMKDPIVHPATVMILLNQAEPDLEKAKREIDEVIAHVAVVRAG
ncbi:MAG TPA: hypothetical protein VFY12_04455 [Arenimonas sp.]|nr:hypothetical protein [Arenimonas sp.]